MGKVNKNIKTKAKKALSTVAVKLEEKKTKSKEKLLLNKTITPKKAISKREKLRQKHKSLINKFSLIKKERKEEIARKNREKTAVIGDLKPLKDALPSLSELLKLSKEKKGDIKTGVREFDEQSEAQKPNTRQKLKRRKDKFISQVKSYQALLKDPDFKRNPRDVISYHIKYTHGLTDDE